MCKPTIVGNPTRPSFEGSEVALPLKLARIFIEDCAALDWSTWGVEFAIGKLLQVGIHHFEGSDRPSKARVFVYFLGRRYGHELHEDWQAAIDKWEDVVVEHDEYMVEFTYIGEGFSGDYDPSDKSDSPHLRFYGARWNPEAETTYLRTDGSLVTFPGAWEDGDDCSYCTRLTVKASDKVLERTTELVADAMNSSSPKRRLEELSWMTEGDIECDISAGHILDSLERRQA
jgi:hypothetical protein